MIETHGNGKHTNERAQIEMIETHGNEDLSRVQFLGGSYVTVGDVHVTIKEPQTL
jgi:hypothetical protein